MNKNSKQWHGPYLNSVHYDQVPYWKRAHNDLRTWVGVALMFAVINIYVMGDNFVLRSRLQPPPVLAAAVGK